MRTQEVTPFVAGHVIPPLLRPLPVIFAYAHRVAENRAVVEEIPSLRDEFNSHLDCFVAMVKAAAGAAELPGTEYSPVVRKAKDLASAESSTLVSKIDQLDLELAHFSEVHKSALRQAYNMRPDLFKSVYKQHVKARKLILVYQASATEGVPKLQETLTERCYYEVKAVEEAYLLASLRKAEFVVFAPTQEPISSQAVDRIRGSGVPFVVLVNLGTDLQKADMVQTRLAGLYQKNGIPILHRPFPAIRLFHKVDRMIIENVLAARPVPEAAVSKRKTTKVEVG